MRGMSAGEECGRRVREKSAGEECGRRVREKSAGEECGRRVREKSAGEECVRRVREKSAGKSTGEECGVSRVPILVYSQQDDSSCITVILLYSTSKGLYSKSLYFKINNLLL